VQEGEREIVLQDLWHLSPGLEGLLTEVIVTPLEIGRMSGGRARVGVEGPGLLKVPYASSTLRIAMRLLKSHIGRPKGVSRPGVLGTRSGSSLEYLSALNELDEERIIIVCWEEPCRWLS